MSLPVGARIGLYEVLSAIGAGGMGEVYRARDTRLNRDVALKVLPALFAADRDRLARFDREAQTLAALNHPNIAQIYGVVDAPAVDATPLHALVMELVPGEDLARHIARGPIPIAAAIRIAAQIAEALDAAHERGIVHRDLKPANVKLTPDGTVKVLDFGLAKAMDPVLASAGAMEDAATFTSPSLMTQGGVVLGTAPYMAPEQARGQAVDRRADIWAFGCVLYEMLTGRRAFRGDTLSDVSAAILTADPDWSALPPGTPAHVRRVLARLLQKDPKRRARDIADVRFELEGLGIEGHTDTSAEGTGRGGRIWRVLALLSTSLAAGLGVWLLFGNRRAADVRDFVGSRAIVTQLTNYGGIESGGAIAPDGGSFVYVSTVGTQSDIFLRQAQGGDPFPLTNDLAAEADLVFAPNGETVYFTREIDGQDAVWRIGTLGANARKVVDNAKAPAVSRDGRQLAWLTRESTGGFSLVIAASDGANPRSLVRGLAFQPPYPPAWSPDGRFVAYSAGGLFQPRNLFVVSVADGSVRQVTRFENSGEGTTTQTWLPDGRHLVVSYWAQSRAQFVSDLGVLDVETGEITRLTMNAMESFSLPSLSRDGGRMIATASRAEREMWKVPDGPDALANGSRAERWLDSSYDPMWTYITRDGRTLLYNNAVIGSRNLWLVPVDRTAKPRQITSVAGDRVLHSSLSPDGARVAFVSSANGHADVWVQEVDGSGLRPLTNDPAAEAWPAWSPDGKSIMYSSGAGTRPRTMIVSADGGEPRLLIDGFFRGDWINQPDGSGTWAVTSVEGTQGIRLIDVENRTELWREPNATALSLPMFNRDGRSISVAFSDGTGRNGIAVYDTATRKRRVAVRFPEPFQFFFRASWIDNDRAFAVNRYRTRSHIVMFDGFLTSLEPAADR
ncbi:MAG TPA: protein kinase [Vicinamibacterales bacterium]|nr:protein kinase [Vicinamibacterales bacterium]